MLQDRRGFLGVRSLPEEVRRTEAMVVGMNADIGYHLEVRTSAMCAVSVERLFVLEECSLAYEIYDGCHPSRILFLYHCGYFHLRYGFIR